MGENEMRALWLEGDVLKLIDQRKLPFELEFYEAKTASDIAFCIKDMVVRGAPAIGCAAAYGYALGSLQEEKGFYDTLLNTRPTAYDLKYALVWMRTQESQGSDLLESAGVYTEQIVSRCKRIGMNGVKVLKDNMTILTHCNAGALATVDWGTALAPMRMARRSGLNIKVLVDETRPRLQGAYLTAWELSNEGIEHYLISDNAAGHYLSRGEVDAVIVGADRICKNGDFANKIGTYEKAVVARENSVPFYVAAPVSTFDLSINAGEEIPIEERAQDEVLTVRGQPISDPGTPALNPAFDVTPARYVTEFITEDGIIRAEEIPTEIVQ